MKWFLVALLLLQGCREASLEPLTVEAYVWQAAGKPAVRTAMDEAVGLVSKLHVRVAEMRWDGEGFSTQWFIDEIPRRGCGLVVRIGSSASGIDWTPTRTEEVAEVFRKVARLSPSEIQCDFDCPQKRLKGYKSLLDGLQDACGNIPVLPTALPSWLDENDFSELVRGRAGWVLQVHSLHLPSGPDEAPVLFDRSKARIAAEKASKLGVPFRIAMATYGCEVRFDREGRVLDVVSEDLTEMNSKVWKRSFALADPVESARLVSEWKQSRPKDLTGLIWYRLPVQGDRRNWPLKTFRSVIHGEVLSSSAVLEATAGHGARDLTVVNHDAFPVALPRKIFIDGEVALADGSRAYQVERIGEGVRFSLRDDVWPWLDPGKEIALGWLRLEEGKQDFDWNFE
ncbi:MAG: DUF3142 domain-containing protein [Akkermansiaceae bacterium]